MSEMCKVIEDMRKEEREEGRREGIREGRQEGRREGMKKVALRMLAAGKYAMEEVAAISELSLDEVKSLQTSYHP